MSLAEERPLEEVVEKFIDYRGKTPTKTSSGIPLITAKIVKGGFIQEPQEFIAEADYDAWMRRGLPENGDVVLTTEAPLGEVAQISTDKKVALAQRIITLRGKSGVLDNTFLRYSLQSKTMQHRLTGRSSGSTVSGIKSSELKKVLIPLPPFKEQQSIANTLSSLDEKIELNRKQNRILEAIAQALFKHWFVDFEFPDENGRPYKSSGGAMQPSELGEIPVGWKIGCIGDFVAHKKKSINPASEPDTEFNHFSIPNFDADRDAKIELGGTIQSNKYRVEENSILVSKLNPRFPRIWAVLGLPGPNSICSTEFQVFVPKESSYSFVLCLLKSPYVRSEMVNRVSGTSGSHQRINPADLLSIEIPIPPGQLICKFNEAALSSIQKQAMNLEASKTLASVRDTLLPKLMSGELRVS
ncbi:restriction endonuclease subunit S [Parahaliea mediterranea]|uniref:Restriction endonuclease subunit S n=1 Tax=Parahaliea mediterranea TaxID=651086 RepID=A0A939DJ22_9GAMM|nr:restriction endonuclease subunit S [Parahaliea mediterranea]MBN7798746.1 restriction endonuclease subunit S [Parahaliea mediterranea]